MTNVLFVCLHNAGRSQMSKAIFERAAGSRYASECAGTQPAGVIHPIVVRAMKEIDIDLGGRVPSSSPAGKLSGPTS